jgi:hypothetical protein
MKRNIGKNQFLFIETQREKKLVFVFVFFVFFLFFSNSSEGHLPDFAQLH